jgi:hypothetical protein
MRKFVEFAISGGGRVVLDTSMIVGVRMPDHKLKRGTTENPVHIMTRNGLEYPVVAIEPAMILGRMNMIEVKADELREANRDIPIVVDWLERDDD